MPTTAEGGGAAAIAIASIAGATTAAAVDILLWPRLVPLQRAAGERAPVAATHG